MECTKATLISSYISFEIDAKTSGVLKGPSDESVECEKVVTVIFLQNIAK